MRLTGFIQLRRLDHDETPWFFSKGKEFGLWYLTIHAKYLRFEIIGPFQFKIGNDKAVGLVNCLIHKWENTDV